MALGFGRCVVSATRRVLLHLAENPGIRGGGAADHHSVATGFADHALGVFGRVDVAIPDDGNIHGLLHGRDDAPVGGAGVPLEARTRMDSDAFDPDVFRPS